MLRITMFCNKTVPLKKVTNDCSHTVGVPAKSICTIARSDRPLVITLYVRQLTVETKLILKANKYVG